GIAEVLLNLGFEVSGSDVAKSDYTRTLEKLGAQIFIGHRRENITNTDVVVWSSAITRDNPEILEALSRKIPTIRRAEMLAELMRLKKGIAVAGTHGKTTTTSMVSLILTNAGLDPTIVIGGKLNNIGSGAKLGAGEYLVAEADESDGSFMKLFPQYSIVTNIDTDHLDHYGTLENIKQTFLKFIDKLPFYGLCVLCIDDDNIKSILPEIRRRYITYGFLDDADITIANYKIKWPGAIFDVMLKKEKLGVIELSVPGRHNVLNSLAAIGIATELEIPFDIIRDTLKNYRGVQRRFQIKCNINNILVVDDYGHHPSELQATLSAARSNSNKRVIAVFQPHRYTRTKLLFDDFGKSFNDADIVIITDIYAASEQKIEGVTSELIINSLKKYGKENVIYFDEFSKIVDYLLETAQSGDIILTLGAGDIWKVSEELSKKLIKKFAERK
ncbi:MAG TPA: UDP-N-acetylmuramate--L-alanine ligase, partial [bacterium]|nr:UDP-N-acetylmuramate--L-alanine ligase [bacterium]